MGEPGRSITRKEFDEVIRRAAEIAASEPEGGDAALTEEDLFRIAREVGLEERHVRKALVQVKSSVPQVRGPISSLYGPRFVMASRVVPGTRESLGARMDEFMVAGNLLESVRRTTAVLQYRPPVDWVSQLARAAASTSRKYHVASAKRIEVRFEPMGDGNVHVEMEVDPGTRGDYLAGGVAGGLAAGAVSGVGVALALVAALPVAAGVAAGAGILVGSAVFGGLSWTTGHYHKRRLGEVRSEMEGILDRLESGESLEPPPASWRRWVQRHFRGVARDLMGESEG
jgi:acyl-coenzyme A thioesterase PaaI-like protein